MNLACQKAQTHPSEIFRYAVFYEKRGWNIKEQMVEYKTQTADGAWADWVLDVCLLLLAGRLELWYTEVEFRVNGESVQTVQGAEAWIIRPLNHLTPAERWKSGLPPVWSESDGGVPGFA